MADIDAAAAFLFLNNLLHVTAIYKNRGVRNLAQVSLYEGGVQKEKKK